MDFNIDIDIDDILSSCSRREKRELYDALIEDGEFLTKKEQAEKRREEELREKIILMEKLQAMNAYELKKTLCDLLGVASYCNEQGLRTALESIIKA